ncbi:hypothetical protein PLESTB_000015800 [Pleodorina starrii]|uniref:Ankyrin repeat domain-containing protein n=1 Tax=Pleodorina starrii TaxID=330485 RepID=A0A9W6B9T8_9CHLO|nr:hypothetical protein PLESTM_001118900 [Pleodorina starrii]GLC47692.1 hypothetical protein PLESTB_000015800 [Pleodorina starrii]GLC70897.1 hypothetical protein PLESTF_001044500 [Pleodorina starrii]
MDSDDDQFYDAEDVFDELCSEGEGPALSTTPNGAPAGPAPATAGAEAAASDAGAATSSAPTDQPQEPFPLHRAAWNGQVDVVRRLAAGLSREQLKALDSQGNTALHVAVMRRRRDVVSELLAAGCSASSRNSRGWGPLMEAVELGDREMAMKLAAAEVAQVRSAVKVKKSALLALLRSELPDFSLQLKWELGSSMPGVGALVRRYAPHDTYTLWKKGGLIRVDGSLMGVDSEGGSVVPSWKRGHFSLLYDASGDRARAVIVNHTDKTFLDVKAARKKFGAAGGGESAALETEVDMLLSSEVLQHKKVRSVDFRFKPVAGWLTKEVREKVEGWNCKLYEAAGRLVAVTHYKMPYGLTPDMSYDDYLAARFESDPVVESPVNPMNPASLKDRGMNPAKAAAKLAVAAKHQRIAAAAAAAQDEQAAAVAKAAAARAAAGGLRALAPRIDDDEGAEEGEGEEAGEGEGGERGSGRERRSNGKARKAAAGGKAGSRPPPDATLVVASVESSAVAGREEGEGGEEAEGGEGEAAGADLSEVDLTALAARVAAEAAEAQRAKRGEDEDDADAGDDDEGGGGGGGGCSGGAAESEAEARAGKAGRGGCASSGTAAAAAGPSSSSAAAAAAGGAKCGKGGGKESTRGSSGKAWLGWGFGKKTPEPPGDGRGGDSGGGGGGASSSGGGGAIAAAAKRSRKISGRCWMAESFPLSLKQLLPLLEVVGTANKVFAKVARFMQKYGDLAMFPVKVQVPLILTVYVLLSFKQFRLLGEGQGRAPPPPDDFFLVPPGYTEDKMEHLQKAEAGPDPAAGEERNGAEGGPEASSGAEPGVADANASGHGDGHGGERSSGDGGRKVAAAPRKDTGGSSSSRKGPAGVGRSGGSGGSGGDGGGPRRGLTLLRGDVMDDEMGLAGGVGTLDD